MPRHSAVTWIMAAMHSQSSSELDEVDQAQQSFISELLLQGAVRIEDFHRAPLSTFRSLDTLPPLNSAENSHTRLPPPSSSKRYQGHSLPEKRKDQPSSSAGTAVSGGQPSKKRKKGKKVN